ncbi:twitching motility protein PilT [Oleiphilus sp. HI0009]|uniref:type II toxin-antitoxin system VapC family toxin n=1 Tax=unclassified Oleiphilus TaxID=2631174 RepID=UPI0007C28366|nr:MULTISPECIES: PIN domain nuclease [unclassified Oleiphilus]KZX82957.1 twitching motility protein PilT [Oleiphilus sp. HI0009]KZY64621.1 twitching motility protein PilT [Oleiphilus sp. HI0066]KZY67808.1 twitching motility protein PilT [Oleiphilus sp. HI0067]
MIIADTSVWIDYFNGVTSPFTDELDKQLMEGNVALGDLILLEILQGIKSDKDYSKTKKLLSKLDQYEMLGNRMVVECADYYRLLRKKGITVRKTADVIIATFCIDNKLPLLFTDKDFKPFVEHCGLISAISKT